VTVTAGLAVLVYGIVSTEAIALTPADPGSQPANRATAGLNSSAPGAGVPADSHSRPASAMAAIDPANRRSRTARVPSGPGAVRAGCRPGGVVVAVQGAEGLGVAPGPVGIALHDVQEGQPDLVALSLGELHPGQRLREPGHIVQGQLEVEEALVELLARRSPVHRGGVTQLGVEHQGGLVEPQQLGLEAAGGPRVAAGVIEHVEDRAGHLLRPGGE